MGRGHSNAATDGCASSVGEHVGRAGYHERAGLCVLDSKEPRGIGLKQVERTWEMGGTSMGISQRTW